MDNTLYDYSPIVGRPPIRWPNGARIAFYVGLNIEHYLVDRPGASLYGSSTRNPDALNQGWRDYGNRVGIWRMIDALDKFGLRASVLLNSDVCSRYPQIIEAGKQRNWAWCAHGLNNSAAPASVTVEEERAELLECVSTISRATGQTIKGWLGPNLVETYETPRLLKELGLTYLLDWCCDDQPFQLNVPGMISVPYGIELNDWTLFLSRGFTGDQFVQMVIDNFDQLYGESESSGRVMSICLHPFIVNQPFRQKYLEQALAYVTSHQGVWLTTSDEIAAHYISSQPQ